MMKKNINFGNYYKLINKRRSFICGIKGLKLNRDEIYFLNKFKPWGIILFSRNISNISQVSGLTNSIKKIFKDPNYPILIDEEGGRVCRLSKIIDNSFFNASMFGKIYDKDKKNFKSVIKTYIKNNSYVLNKLGININTVPVLDIKRKNYHKIIGDRAYSSDPKKISIIGNFVIKEFEKNRINTVIKHIPGHGLAKSDSHIKLPIVYKKYNYLKKNDFYTFQNKKCLLAMTAHIVFHDIDSLHCATHSKKIVNIIRKKIKFKNLLITDDISMRALKYSIKLNTTMAFNAGCNIVMHCNGKMNEMKIVAQNSPFLSSFIKKKTSQLLKKVS